MPLQAEPPMFFMPFHEREPTPHQGPGPGGSAVNGSQLHHTGAFATSLFGIYSPPHAPGSHKPRYARHTQASRGPSPPVSPRPQRSFIGAKGSSFNRSAVVMHLAGELASEAQHAGPRSYYRGNVRLVGENYEPLRALR